MKNLTYFSLFLLLLSYFFSTAASAQETKNESAREALSATEDEQAREAKQLEEVFQAQQESYSLLRQGEIELTYGSQYSYFKDTHIELDVEDGFITSFDLLPAAEHKLTNVFTIDYGVLDNLTISARVPFIVAYETETDRKASSIGDIETSLRWQPFASKPGKMTTTVFASLLWPSGTSPYDIKLDDRLPVGSGYWSLGLGVNVSKIIDPVVLFGSLSYNYNFKETGLNQVRGGRILEEVDPGDSISLSLGFAYSLSYDVSLSMSFQQSYSLQSEFKFNDGGTIKTTDQASSIMNIALGIRTSPEHIINVNAGFGLTEDSPDVLLGFSIPIDISGLKETK